MAEYQIIYWRDIPSMVIGREGRRNQERIQLSERFQVAIDEAAMRAGLTGTDAYSEQWRRTQWEPHADTPGVAAQEVAAQLEAEYDAARLRALMGASGRAQD